MPPRSSFLGDSKRRNQKPVTGNQIGMCDIIEEASFSGRRRQTVKECLEISNIRQWILRSPFRKKMMFRLWSGKYLRFCGEKITSQANILTFEFFDNVGNYKNRKIKKSHLAFSCWVFGSFFVQFWGAHSSPFQMMIFTQFDSGTFRFSWHNFSHLEHFYGTCGTQRQEPALPFKGFFAHFCHFFSGKYSNFSPAEINEACSKTEYFCVTCWRRRRRGSFLFLFG